MMAFYIKQGDTSPSIETILESADGTVIIDLTSANVNFRMKHAQQDVSVSGACTIVDEDGGRVRYDWLAGDTAVSGWYRAQFEVTYVDEKFETFPNDGFLWIKVDEDI
jgi:5-hydroxyisourate hydrolase-like protein (transthyretin family)